jgi:integrase-like protein
MRGKPIIRSDERQMVSRLSRDSAAENRECTVRKTPIRRRRSIRGKKHGRPRRRRQRCNAVFTISGTPGVRECSKAAYRSAVVASILGWSAATTVRMAKRYRHIGQIAQRQAVSWLEHVPQPKPEPSDATTLDATTTTRRLDGCCGIAMPSTVTYSDVGSPAWALAIVSSPSSPWQNPYAERLIGSIRRECLDHVIVLGERHLRRLLTAYLTDYHGARTHLA